jgi:hypothetical protein
MGYGDIEIKSNGKFLRIESGQPQDVRILDESPTVKVVHGFGKDAVSCTGEGCFKCQDGSEAKQRFTTNVYNHTTKRVMIWEFGTGIAKKLKELDKSLSEEGKTLMTVDLKVDATGSNMTKKYSVTPRMTTKPIPEGLVLHKLDRDDLPF